MRLSVVYTVLLFTCLSTPDFVWWIKEREIYTGDKTTRRSRHVSQFSYQIENQNHIKQFTVCLTRRSNSYTTAAMATDKNPRANRRRTGRRGWSFQSGCEHLRMLCGYHLPHDGHTWPYLAAEPDERKSHLSNGAAASINTSRPDASINTTVTLENYY